MADADKQDGTKHPDLDTLKRWYKQSEEAFSEQRRREREALRFQDPDLQWTEEAKAQRRGGPGQPPRPMLAVSKVEQPIRMVVNQMRNAHLGVSLHPLSPDANDETAEVLQDLYRSIERDSNAQEGREFAFRRAVICGLGYYRIISCYDESAPDEGVEAFDQVPRIQRILYQDEVLWDPSAQLADFSDANFVFAGAWVAAPDVRREYPKADISGKGDDFLKSADYPEPKWIRGDGADTAVRIVECLYKLKETEEITYTGPDGEESKRHKDRVKVYSVKICGNEILEEPQPTNGQYLPIVTVVGRELVPFDGKRQWDGIVAPNMGAQRAFNYAITGAIEAAALEPKAPFIGVSGQFEGHPEWDEANTKNFAKLEYEPVVIAGALAPPPQRAQVDGSRMQMNVMLAQSMEGALQSGTLMFDPALGRSSGNEKSGKAIQSLQEAGNAATSDFLANYADNSLRYEARVILDLIPAMFDRQQRIVRILDDQDKVRSVMLNTPYVQQQDGTLMVSDPRAQGAKTFDLRKGRYAIAVSVGRSRQTKMEAVAEELGQILASRPEMMEIIGPEYFRHRDFSGAKSIADILLRLRDHNMPFLRDPDQPMDLNQAMARAQAAEGQLQEMQQAMQAMQQELQMETAKQQTQMATAQIGAASKVETARIKSQTDIAIEEMRQRLKALEEATGRQHEDQQADKDVIRDGTREATKVALQPFQQSVGKPLAAPKGEV